MDCGITGAHGVKRRAPPTRLDAAHGPHRKRPCSAGDDESADSDDPSIHHVESDEDECETGDEDEDEDEVQGRPGAGSDGSASHSRASSDAPEGLPVSVSDLDFDHGLSRMQGQQHKRRRPTDADDARPVVGSPARSAVLLRSFAALKISPPLLEALSRMAIRVPTPVQAACIPPLLLGRDCIGNAKTGSGKTIAFALPILQQLSADPYGIYALVLTPTRELAFQISEQFAVLGASLNLHTAVIVGGMDMIAQALELDNRPHVVVATPGRIVDHLRSSRGEWDLSRVKFLVLDEADRLLTPTFTPELSHLFSVLPRERQTCLFTATLTPAIENLAASPPRAGKEKPFVHRMEEPTETVETLKQYYVLVPSYVREAYLYYLLCHPPELTIRLRRRPPEPQKNLKKKRSSKPRASNSRKPKDDEDEIEQPPPTIIFCARTRTAAYLTSVLKTLSIRSTALHSRLTQRERLSSLSLFRSFVVPVLVSTDVGSRGLDIEDVAMVINWDLPNEPEEYTHRVGRTARAGKGGVAISFVTERDEERVLRIEDRIHVKLAEMTLPEERVLEQLNTVSTAKRLANMELHDTNFGIREKVHKAKTRTT